MIRVNPVAEPPEFHKKVRQPGTKFLEKVPKPTSRQWKSYWTRVKPYLYESYGGVCSYLSLWISFDDTAEVEHFVPKSKDQKLAYEWTNYRLASRSANGLKRDREDVIDPFQIGDQWFVLNFFSREIEIGDNAPPDQKGLLESTIARLKLNDENKGIKYREIWLSDYISGDIKLGHLARRAPFIAAELKRQKLVKKIKAFSTLQNP